MSEIHRLTPPPQIKAIQVSVNLMIGRVSFPIPLPVDFYTFFMSQLTKNPIPGGKAFVEFAPTGNIANFDDRWNWIQGDANEGMYYIWIGSSSTHEFTPTMRLEKVKMSLSERARYPYAWFPSYVP